MQSVKCLAVTPNQGNICGFTNILICIIQLIHKASALQRHTHTQDLHIKIERFLNIKIIENKN